MVAYNIALALALALCFLCRYSVQSAFAPRHSTESAVIGNMALPVTLPGVLDSPTALFYKDGLRVSPNSPLYKVTPVSGGYQVVIRFLSCSDEGHYVLGGKRFVVIASPNNRGVYYRYTAKTDGDVDKIYVLPVDRNNPYVWRVVWNSTMDRNDRPTDCCLTASHYMSATHGIDSCRMCIYKHIGPANAQCSQHAGNQRDDGTEISSTTRTYSSM